MSRILIVEDEPRIAAFIEKGLRKYGFETQIAVEGQQALEQVSSGNFDLMLLDLGLPKINGWDVLRELRQQGNPCPVIVISATSEASETVLEAGATGFFTKPFRFLELLDAVNAQLKD